MKLSAQAVCIVGPHRMRNEVLVDFLHVRLGVSCRMATVLDRETAGDALVLLDCLGSDRDSLLQWLRRSSAPWSSERLLALFNLGKGLGVERAALDAGVRGLFFEDDSAETLLKGISAVFGGELWVARKILSEYLLSRENPPPAEVPSLSPLTRREREVLTMLTHGASNTQIGSRMCISVPTVKTHLYNIFRKIQVSSRLEAALWTARRT